MSLKDNNSSFKEKKYLNDIQNHKVIAAVFKEYSFIVCNKINRKTLIVDFITQNNNSLQNKQ